MLNFMSLDGEPSEPSHGHKIWLHVVVTGKDDEVVFFYARQYMSDCLACPRHLWGWQSHVHIRQDVPLAGWVFESSLKLAELAELFAAPAPDSHSCS